LAVIAFVLGGKLCCVCRVLCGLLLVQFIEFERDTLQNKTEGRKKINKKVGSAKHFWQNSAKVGFGCQKCLARYEFH
jgi:hypothetical protein